MHATDRLVEADRLMTICNSCRYCEGLCAVFPAMELRRAFTDGDLDYLANLCHGCGACYVDCQFAPPHEFAVNVPLALAELRVESWRRHARPKALRGLFARNGLAVALVAAESVVFCLLAFGRAPAPSGSFYSVMPHDAMAVIFGAGFLYAVVALAAGARAFWRATGGGPITWADLREAGRDAARLRYLDGGGPGCYAEDAVGPDRRRLWHHLTFYGFLLCFAATTVATFWHYLFAREAPYPWYDLPVVLGTLGGIGLAIGPIGLLRERHRRDPAIRDRPRVGMDVAFLASLWLTGTSGLALLLLRGTDAMAPLLALHLGFVFAFFLTMPHSRFVHGLYRSLALVRYARERRMLASGRIEA